MCVCVCVCVFSFSIYVEKIWDIYIYIYIYIVEEGLDGHGLLLLRVSRVMRSSDNSCPSSPSSTILRSAYMALNTLQQDWLL